MTTQKKAEPAPSQLKRFVIKTDINMEVANEIEARSEFKRLLSRGYDPNKCGEFEVNSVEVTPFAEASSSENAALDKLRKLVEEEKQGIKKDRQKFPDIDQRLACDHW